MTDTTTKKDRKAQFDGELVVLHDMVSYKDPDHEPVPGQPTGLLYASRGTVLGDDDNPAPTNQEVDRLKKLGAVTADKDTIDAKLALAGQRPESSLLPPPYISLTSPAEQVRAVQAAGRYPGGVALSSSKRDLARLSIGDLKVMAVAFGYPELAESDSPDEIIDTLTGGADDAADAQDVATQRQARDERQVAARDVVGTQREPGLVGTNVTSSGMNAETGEKTDETPRRRASKVQKS